MSSSSHVVLMVSFTFHKYTFRQSILENKIKYLQFLNNFNAGNYTQIYLKNIK